MANRFEIATNVFEKSEETRTSRWHTSPTGYVPCSCGSNHVEITVPLSEVREEEKWIKFYTRESNYSEPKERWMQVNHTILPDVLSEHFYEEGNSIRFAICKNCKRILRLKRD